MGTISDARYAVTFDGNPRTNAARLKTLVHGGPLTLAKEHWAASMLPGCFDRTTSDTVVKADMVDLYDLMIGGTIYDDDVKTKNTIGAVGVTRWSQFFFDMEQDGVDTTTIDGPPSVALPLARQRLTSFLKTMEVGKRTIKYDDMIYDNEGDPATDTWFDFMTPARILAGDGKMDDVAQFLTSSAWRWYGSRK